MPTELLDSMLDAGCGGDYMGLVSEIIGTDGHKAKRLTQEFVWKKWDMSLPRDEKNFDCLCDIARTAASMTGQAELVAGIPPACVAYKLASKGAFFAIEVIRFIGRLVLFFVILGMTDFHDSLWSCAVGFMASMVLSRVFGWHFAWEVSMVVTAVTAYIMSGARANPERLFYSTLWTTGILFIIITVWRMIIDRFTRIGTAVPPPSSIFIKQFLPRPNDL